MKLEFGPVEGRDDEAIEVYGRADHCGTALAGGGRWDRGRLPLARHQQRDGLRLEGRILNSKRSEIGTILNRVPPKMLGIIKWALDDFCGPYTRPTVRRRLELGELRGDDN